MSQLTAPGGGAPESAPRILHAKFTAYLGWSQPFIHSLVQGLGSHYRTTVLCGRRENAERFPVDDLLCVKTRVLSFPAMAAAVAFHLRRTRAPELLHAHFGWSGIRLLLLQAVLGIPWITTFGGRDAAVQRQDPRLRDLYRCLLERCDRIVCVSEEIRGSLADAGVEPGRLVLIRRGTDVEAFGFVDRSSRPAGALRLVMVGRLVEKKDHDMALEGIARLRAQGIPVVLRIVGEGEKAAEIRRLRDERGLGDAVEIYPPTDRNGVAAHMAWADVFVHCSRTSEDGDREGIPNAMVEGAATGLPILGTRHGGIPEVVRHGETGLLVPERNVEAFTDALRWLARRRDERLELGRTGARLVRRELDLKVQLTRHRELYEKVLAEPRAHRPALPENLPETLAEAFGLPSAPCGKIGLVARWIDQTLAPRVEGVLPWQPGARRGLLVEKALWAARPVARRVLRPEVRAALRVRVERRLNAMWAALPDETLWKQIQQGEALDPGIPLRLIVDHLLEEPVPPSRAGWTTERKSAAEGPRWVNTR